MYSVLLSIIYLAFISLGLPDSLLGSAWPAMFQQFAVPVSYGGIVSMIIAFGTIFSSLQSDKLTKKLGPGGVTLFSVLLTAVALFGFSTSHSFFLICLWAIPYGLGAGSVDAALNNYVALHYASRHMNWLHCMWGIGASLGPYIMGFALARNGNWNTGYRYVAILQMVLTALLFLGLPLWKTNGPGKGEASGADKKDSPLSMRQVLNLPSAKAVMISFFCYCALEQTTGLWASSFLVLHWGLSPEAASGFASVFFIGITVGRGISGFLTMKRNDTQMIRLGQGLVLSGILLLMLPSGAVTALTGFLFIGLGCAPIYPCMIHSTPSRFGAEKSQAVIGMQMAFAYIGTCFMPPIFGFLAGESRSFLFPYYILAILILMVFFHERSLKQQRD